MWTEGALSNYLCSCGSPFRTCEFWASVGEKAFGGWDRPEILEAGHLGRYLDRLRMIPFLLAPYLLPGIKPKVERYRSLLARLYGAIQTVSNAHVIVDSSKLPATAVLLAGIKNIELFVLHLVRDSRGVAYSWSKRVRKPDSGRLMPTYHPAIMSTRWILTNTALNGLASLKIPVLLMRYEDLCTHPPLAISQILGLIGIGGEHSLSCITKERSITFSRSTHVIAGNYNKMACTTVIRRDDEWRTAMPPISRLLVTFLTWPLLLKYGYFSNRSRSHTKDFHRGA